MQLDANYLNLFSTMDDLAVVYMVQNGQCFSNFSTPRLSYPLALTMIWGRGVKAVSQQLSFHFPECPYFIADQIKFILPRFSNHLHFSLHKTGKFSRENCYLVNFCKELLTGSMNDGSKHSPHPQPFPSMHAQSYWPSPKSDIC